MHRAGIKCAFPGYGVPDFHPILRKVSVLNILISPLRAELQVQEAIQWIHILHAIVLQRMALNSNHHETDNNKQ